MLKGSRVELAMRPDRFFFRAIELPRRATEFLDGVVRAQIDRITPWDAGEAVFGWSAPTELSNDRISVTIAATARPQIIPLIQAIGHLGVKSIAVSTTLPDEPADKAAIKIFEQSATGTLEVRQVRRALVAVFLSLAVLCGIGDFRRHRHRQRSAKSPVRCVPPYCRTSRHHPRRQRRRQQFRAGQSGAPEKPNTGERHRDRSSIEHSARQYLCHGTAHRRRQGAGRRHQRRCSVADPPHRAIAAFRSRDIFRADDAIAFRPGGSLSHRSAYQTGVLGPVMTAEHSFDRTLARYPAVAAAAYFIVIVAFLATIWMALANIIRTTRRSCIGGRYSEPARGAPAALPTRQPCRPAPCLSGRRFSAAKR